MLLVATGGLAQRDRAAGPVVKRPPPLKEEKHDVSPPLRTIAPKPKKARKERQERKIPVPAGSGVGDPVVQSTTPKTAAPALVRNFEGISVQDSAPPDTNGAAGPSAYVQIVNQSFQVFTKSGASLYGPVPTNTLWTGFGGGCEENNDGDATVEYDRLADRWVIQQFSISTDPYLECIAVSTSGNPTGSYYRYAFSGFGTEFPDYPKLGVWPDAYYVTYNLFDFGFFFDGPEVCAYNRAKMLVGQSTTAGQCFIVDNLGLGGLLPSDLDGSTAPPSGSPNYVLAFDTGTLELWEFHVDWTTPANSTFTGPTSIPVAAFDPACFDGGACVAQSGTSTKLDSLGDRLMYRNAYRNFGDHESLVVTHSVAVDSASGVRWYELRDPGGTPTVHQQSTYAPDSRFRWMGSAAMDGSGGIALGFSVSSSGTHPGIHFTGRNGGDPLGAMTQGEGVIIDGSGSQTGGLVRWGDYSSMSIDPTDDCTFWYTNEYIPSNGSFNWRTRIASFQLSGCAAAGADDFSLLPADNAVAVTQGDSGATSIGTTVTSGSAQTVALSASGMPYGTTVSFSPSSVTAGNASTMTFDVAEDTPVGTYSITVDGTGPSATQTTTVTLDVTLFNAVENGDFEAGLNGWSTGGDTSPVVVAGKKRSHSPPQGVQLGSATLVPGDSTLSQTVDVPGGKTALTFWYQPHCRNKGTGGLVQAEIRTTGGATLETVLAACENSDGWRKATFDTGAYAGQTVVLWFNAHASGGGSKPKPVWVVLDDVSLGTPLGANMVDNPGFETGAFDSWATGGDQAPAISPEGRKKSAAALLGQTGPFDGDSTITQTVVVPGIKPRLAFWYQPHCTGSVGSDQIQMQVRDTLGAVESTVLETCRSKGWIQVKFDLSAYRGQQVVLYFNVHDDGAAGDPVWALIDDVSVT